MSSKFSSPFFQKSPLTAGGYASGVDGMRYVSPKQPPTITEPKKPKRKIPEKIVSTMLDPTDITITKTEPTSSIKVPTIPTMESKRNIVFSSESNERLTYKEAWKADLEGIRGKYKDYDSYVADRTGQKKNDSKAYEKDLLDKTGLGKPGASATIYYDENQGEGRQIWGGTFNK